MTQKLIFALVGGILGGFISPVFGLMGALFGFFGAASSQTSAGSHPDKIELESDGATFLDNSFDRFENTLNAVRIDDDFSVGTGINPANGLPMAGGVDIAGNPYGTDNSAMDIMNDDTMSAGIDIDNDFGVSDSFMDSYIGGASMDDPFS